MASTRRPSDLLEGASGAAAPEPGTGSVRLDTRRRRRATLPLAIALLLLAGFAPGLRLRLVADEEADGAPSQEGDNDYSQ